MTTRADLEFEVQVMGHAMADLKALLGVNDPPAIEKAMYNLQVAHSRLKNSITELEVPLPLSPKKGWFS